MRFYYNNEGQQYFDNMLIGLLIVFKWAFKLMIYSPFIFTGYIAATHILHKDDHGLLWIGTIALFAYICFLIVNFLKRLVIIFKAKGNLFWIPIFIFCITFTCIFPVWIVFEPIEKLIGKLTPSNIKRLTWMASLAFGFSIYRKYNFLSV